MSDELLPCPFCGEVPQHHIVGKNDRPGIHHLLSDCPIGGRMMTALEWNTRATPRHTEEVVEAAKAELLAEVIKELQGRGDTAYLNGCAWARQDACLGWEQKAKEGRFGKAEMAAHKRFNEYMGAHFALYEAARVVAALSRAPAATKSGDGPCHWCSKPKAAHFYKNNQCYNDGGMTHCYLSSPPPPVTEQKEPKR